LAAWFCFANLAAGSFLRKTDPNAAMKEFEEKTMAVDYMDKWKGKSWDKETSACDVAKLPLTTDAVIFKVCGTDANKKRCTCNIAKAHSCHVGCQKLKTICPSECHAGKCFQGAPTNGGAELSDGGHSGTCHKFCSGFLGGARYCGSGPDYEVGMYLDCKGCAPQKKPESLSMSEKKAQWTDCMAGCYPTPTCVEMCGEGTPECYAGCVQQYKHVVEPYWELFKGSLQAMPMKIAENVNEEEIKEFGEMINKGVDEQVALAEADETKAEKKAEKEEKKVAPKVVEEPPAEEEMEYEEEEEWEDPWAGENEWDEEGEEEWEDPWAGENEWDFMVHRSRVIADKKYDISHQADRDGDDRQHEQIETELTKQIETEMTKPPNPTEHEMRHHNARRKRRRRSASHRGLMKKAHSLGLT